MKRLSWWSTIVLLLISQTYAAEHAKPQESELKADAKDLLKAAATSAEYSTSNDYSTNEKQPQDNVAASSSSMISSIDTGNYNQAEQQPQYSQPLSYSQPGTPVQPIHSYSQPLNYAAQALPYTSESQQIAQQYSTSSSESSSNSAQSQYPSLKDVPLPEIPSASASSQYYPQYPAHQAYNPHLVLQQQASAPASEYAQNNNNVQPSGDQQYDSNQATYVQPAQHQQVYLHHQHHLQTPGSSYSEQSYAVDNGGDKNNAVYPQANGYSQPLPPDYSPEYSHSVQPVNQVKPKKTVILAIPVKLVAKNKYSGQNNGGYSAPPVQDIQPHYSSNVVPAAANLPVTHSMEKNNYYNNEGDKPSFNEKPLYADKQTYPDKVDDYQKVNHNLNNNLQNNGYGNEYDKYETDNGDHYRNQGIRYNVGPPKQINYNSREVKPLSNYQTRQRRPSSYGPSHQDIYPSHGPEYTTSNNGEDEISLTPDYRPEHGNGYSMGEIEHNHIHTLPGVHHKHKISEVYEPSSPVDHLPPPYIPSDFPSLSGPSLGGSLHGLGIGSNPMDLIYSSPYKLAGPPAGKPSGYGFRPLMGSASSQSQTSSGPSSNYGQFLSSLLSAYSLGSLKPSSKPSSSKGGLASYLNNLPGLDLLKGYSSLSPSYASSLLTSASGLNKYYLPPNAKPVVASKPSYSHLGWPHQEFAQPAKPKPTGLLASSSNIVSSIDELFGLNSFKSSLNPTRKRPLYSDATRAITNLYKKLLN